MSDIKVSQIKTVKVTVERKIEKKHGLETNLSISAKTDQDQKSIIGGIYIHSLGFSGLPLSQKEFITLYEMMHVFSEQVGNLDLDEQKTPKKYMKPWGGDDKTP